MTRYLAVVALALLAFACAESTATVTTDDDWNDTPAIRAGLVRSAETILADADPPDDGRTLGVILAENADGWASDWSVLTDAGTTVISAATNCGGGDSIPEADLWQILDPGDLIAWTTDGDDNLICTHEVDIVTKAAA